MKAIQKLLIKGPLADRTQLKELRLAPGMNALAGPNGSGKTTILETIRRGEVDTEPDVPRRYLGFDCELDNPRVRTHLLENGVLYQASTSPVSHGESMLTILTRGLRESVLKDQMAFTVVTVDEPETALDATALVKVLKAWKAMTNVQFVVASHHPLVWAAADRLHETEDAYVARALRMWSSAIRAMQGGRL